MQQQNAKANHLWTCRYLIIAACLTINLITPEGTSAQKITLQLKWKHQFQFAGFYAAHEMGYYDAAGLEVTIVEGRPGVTAIGQVLTGKADFGVDSPAILIEHNKGAPIVVLAAILQHSAEVLITRKDSGIASAHDLIGKRILMRPKVDAQIMAMFNNEGIDIDQLTLIEHTWDPNDLKFRGTCVGCIRSAKI